MDPINPDRRLELNPSNSSRQGESVDTETSTRDSSRSKELLGAERSESVQTRTLQEQIPGTAQSRSNSNSSNQSQNSGNQGLALVAWQNHGADTSFKTKPPPEPLGVTSRQTGSYPWREEGQSREFYSQLAKGVSDRGEHYKYLETGSVLLPEPKNLDPKLKEHFKELRLFLGEYSNRFSPEQIGDKLNAAYERTKSVLDPKSPYFALQLTQAATNPSIPLDLLKEYKNDFDQAAKVHPSGFKADIFDYTVSDATIRGTTHHQPNPASLRKRNDEWGKHNESAKKILMD